MLRKLIIICAVFASLLGIGFGVATKDDVLLSWKIANYHTAMAAGEYERAHTIANQMAVNDYIPARTFLAGLYENGQGVIQNLDIAVEQYKLAAMGNDVTAQVYLAGMYVSGHGVEASEQLAKHWYAKAAYNGHTTTQFKLASR